MYVAKTDIGGYKKGDEVPKDLAEVWNAMYADQPCELVEDKHLEQKSVAPEKKAKKSKARKK